jgi:hypothetical protein
MCAAQGCTQIIPVGVKWCPSCQRAAWRIRPATPNRATRTAIYNDPRWRRCRATVLTREPSCRLCGEPSTTADHYPTTVLECANPFDPNACRALCKHCSGTTDGARGWAATRRAAAQDGHHTPTPTPPTPARAWIA